eukprot:m.15594 g.15594  ORF g.15594 m.15594 type:complete len:80 (+) comp8699_c0_seq2:1722-1961(+)
MTTTLSAMFSVAASAITQETLTQASFQLQVRKLEVPAAVWTASRHRVGRGTGVPAPPICSLSVAQRRMLLILMVGGVTW